MNDPPVSIAVLFGAYQALPNVRLYQYRGRKCECAPPWLVRVVVWKPSSACVCAESPDEPGESAGPAPATNRSRRSGVPFAPSHNAG